MTDDATGPEPPAVAPTSASPDAGGLVFERVGDPQSKIPVSISYRIIELFSGSLYSSPNKALEELVANSYDAGASRVDIVLPGNLAASNATIWVIDDGESMDLGGLVDLWKIARSRKRERTTGRSNPIGKFGIGKLATYVVASKLTYLCKTREGLLGVTMDFNRIDQDADRETDVELAVRSISNEQAAEALGPLRALEGGGVVADRLLSADSGTWTVAAMSALKPAANNVKRGRLEWILSTALPLSPAFALAVNGRAIVSTVEKIEIVDEWKVGENDDLPDSCTVGSDDDGPFVEVVGLSGTLRGSVSVYEDTLTSGKALEWGRSHGFFVQVRGRLVNLDDPLFGLPALSHAAFNRFRMVVDADGLDDFLTSTRESVQSAPAVEAFRAYLRSEFNHARAAYQEWQDEQVEAAKIGTRISNTASSLSRRPLVAAVRRLVDGDLDHLLLTATPSLEADETAQLLVELEESLDKPNDGPIREVEPAALGGDQFIATYDPAARKVLVNVLHPFFANFVDSTKDTLPFEMIAVTEILTEAYLYEEGIAPEIVDRIIRRRDAFLRELVKERRVGPATIAQNIIDQEANEDGLEEALHDAFRSLGFVVTPMGKKGRPDGLAKAIVGVRDGTRRDYSFTYDAKSTGSAAVAAKTVGVSTLARHKQTHRAQYSVVVAKDFEGGDDPGSALGLECAENDVIPIRARDLALLVQVAAARAVPLVRLREMLTTCRTAKQSHDWIAALPDEAENLPPLKAVLEVLIAEQEQSQDAVELSAIVTRLRIQESIETKKEELREWIQALSVMAPGHITILGDIVTLETKKERVLEMLAEHNRELPLHVRAIYMDQWLDTPS
ncbi:MAG: ATP-binding protein [Acidimicrobiales bacterium]|jgi:hypothetical protein